MIAADPAEFFPVSDKEFARHLGYPDGAIPDGSSREVAERARQWFLSHTRPWYASRVVGIERIGDLTVTLETGTQFECGVLADRLRGSRSHSVLAMAVSVGPEVDAEIKCCWEDGRPDDSYALNAYAAAATEQLLLEAGKILCAQIEQEGDTLLQHYSPGYTGWDVGEQALVMSLLKSTHQNLHLNLLESGLLTPQKSMLAVIGITSHLELVPPSLIPCTTCSLADCAIRRLPFDGPLAPPPPDCPPEENPVDSPAPPARTNGYAFPPKALKRWKRQLLEIRHDDENRLRARFTYNGSTCNDGGVPLTFLYDVWLERIGGEFIIREMACQPEEGNRGYKETCSYQTNPRNALSHYENFKPLLGSPLSAAISWNPTRNPAGCLCTAANRNHKWLMALQTIHYALDSDHE